MDAAFHYVKDILAKRQAQLNISLNNAVETGISSVEYAFELWKAACKEIVPPRRGTDGWLFRARKVFKIDPGTLSKSYV